MDSAWRKGEHVPSSASEVAPYEILDPERFALESKDIITFTTEISSQPYDPEPWLYRARSLRLLGYPELSLGDAHKSRLLITAALSRSPIFGHDVFRLVAKKIWTLHMTDPAWAPFKAAVATPELLQERVVDFLGKLEVQVWSELLEGLLAANACAEYGALAREAREKWPGDQVFESEVANADNWAKQREGILKEQVEEGELTAEQMDSTLLNGGVVPVAYPWMEEDLVSRDAGTVKGIQMEFEEASTNCVVQRSMIGSHGDGEDAGEIDVLGVIAKRDIKVGETVLLDRTVSAVTTSEEVCPSCCGPVSGDFTNACCGVRYCSGRCSTTALEEFHTAICGRDFSSLNLAAKKAEQTTDLSIDSLLLLRVLSMTLQTPKVHPLSTSLLARLTPTYDMDQLIIFSYASHISAPHSILTELGIDPYADPNYDNWILHTIRCRLQNNKHGQNFDEILGTAVNPLYSMFNHSCEPNVEWEHVGETSTVRVFARRDIKEGEECCFSYIRPLEMEWKERQGRLRVWFGGGCGCVRCVSERPEESEEEDGEDDSIRKGLEEVVL